jgi:hypothetical protein
VAAKQKFKETGDPFFDEEKGEVVFAELEALIKVLEAEGE